MALAERHNLIVVEDCAHAHGARWRERGTGTFGHFGSFSLQSSKILTTGEGGVLLCRTQTLADAAGSHPFNCGRPADPPASTLRWARTSAWPRCRPRWATWPWSASPSRRRQREAMLNYAEEVPERGARGASAQARPAPHHPLVLRASSLPSTRKPLAAGHERGAPALRAEGIPPTPVTRPPPRPVVPTRAGRACRYPAPSRNISSSTSCTIPRPSAPGNVRRCGCRRTRSGPGRRGH